jgi:hypothetical protein
VKTLANHENTTKNLVFEAFFSIITPRRSIASRHFIRNMIENFEKVENFELRVKLLYYNIYTNLRCMHLPGAA